VFVIGIAYQLVVSHRPDDTAGRRDRGIFIASSVSIAGLVGIWAVGNYPVLVPARNLAGRSLTASSAAATHSALTALLVLAIIGIPLMLAYTTVVYRLFRGRSRVATDDSGETGSGY